MEKYGAISFIWIYETVLSRTKKMLIQIPSSVVSYRDTSRTTLSSEITYLKIKGRTNG